MIRLKKWMHTHAGSAALAEKTGRLIQQVSRWKADPEVYTDGNAIYRRVGQGVEIDGVVYRKLAEIRK